MTRHKMVAGKPKRSKSRKSHLARDLPVEKIAIEKIKPYENNPRDNEAAVDAVAASITEFGWRQPIVVDPKMVIVCGHTRWKAAMKLGLKVVPVHVARDLTAKQVKALRIADNKTHELSTWNADLLGLELAALGVGQAGGVDIDFLTMGFTAEEMVNLTTDDPPTTTGGDGGRVSTYQVTVTCDDPKSQKQLAARLRKQGYTCKLVTT